MNAASQQQDQIPAALPSAQSMKDLESSSILATIMDSLGDALKRNIPITEQDVFKFRSQLNNTNEVSEHIALGEPDVIGSLNAMWHGINWQLQGRLSGHPVWGLMAKIQFTIRKAAVVSLQKCWREARASNPWDGNTQASAWDSGYLIKKHLGHLSEFADASFLHNLYSTKFESLLEISARLVWDAIHEMNSGMEENKREGLKMRVTRLIHAMTLG
ncbi:hypothetical protein LOZ65_006864 [Ophidiomyces ophidiicola]|nr:hypothetical protein LOZ65_006864 [Ophidiomyces ophidiicola]